MISKITFLAKASERQSEARAWIAEYPAEEDPPSINDCIHMARRLVGGNDLELEFAVFIALLDRYDVKTGGG